MHLREVGVAPIMEKMVESHHRWFGNVWRRPRKARLDGG